MIIDIPTSDDFRSVGMALLNTAWDTATSLLIDVDDAQYYEEDTEEVKDAYWDAARVQLSTALSVAQQGSEFLLKAKIAEVSPYLLLGLSPKDWPGGCASTNLPFSDFRTVDAQDLVKVYNTARSDRLPDDFVQRFEQLRKLRNSIMHSIDKRLSVHVADLMQTVLFINRSLGQDSNWPRVRHTHLREAPLSQMHSSDWADQRLVHEFSVTRNLLQSAILRDYFNFETKQRSYICPNCSYSLAGDADVEAKSATLRPKASNSTNLWCFVCNEDQNVVRQDCSESDCKGNVISEEWGRCLTCGTTVD